MYPEPVGDHSRSFGARSVDPQVRKELVGRVFQQVAPRYDLMNDLMSFGIHRLWKRSLSTRVAANRGEVIIDLAGGTGDVACLLIGSGASVIVCDPSLEMMQVGRCRRQTQIEWLAGTGESLPVATGSVDCVTMAFGLRNMTHMDAALREAFRVLKPGGRFFCLEFSTPVPVLRQIYGVWSRLVIPRLGAVVSRNRLAYQYLVDSIRVFPDQREIAAIIEGAGFVEVSWENLMLGIAAMHSGRRS